VNFNVLNINLGLKSFYHVQQTGSKTKHSTSDKTDGQILTCKSLNYSVHAMTTTIPVMDKQHSALY